MKCFLLLFCLIGFLFNVELVIGITSSNVALVGMYFFIIVAIYERRYRIVRLSTMEVLLPLFVLVIIGILALANDGVDSYRQIKESLSWCFLLFPFSVGVLFHKEIVNERFARLCGIAAVVLSVYVLAKSTLVGLDSLIIRVIVGDDIAGGINGFMYGLFFLQSLYLLGERKNGVRGEWILWLLTLTLPIFAGLVLGSRQYLVGVMIFVILTSLFRSRNIGGVIGRNVKYTALLAIVLTPGILIYLVRGVVLDRYFLYSKTT